MRLSFCVTILLPFLLAMPCAAEEAAMIYKAATLVDFVADFPKARKINQHQSAVVYTKCGGYERLAIYNHPPGAGKGEARLIFKLDLPALQPGEHLYFASYLGLGDGFSTAGRKDAHDGVHFSVLAGETRLAKVLHNHVGWTPVALCLDDFAGTTLDFALANDPVSASVADWSHWGEPRILHLKPACKDAVFPAVSPVMPDPESATGRNLSMKGFYLMKTPYDPVTWRTLESVSVDADSGQTTRQPLHYFVGFSDYVSSSSKALNIRGQWRSSGNLTGIVLE